MLLATLRPCAVLCLARPHCLPSGRAVGSNFDPPPAPSPPLALPRWREPHLAKLLTGARSAPSPPAPPSPVLPDPHTLLTLPQLKTYTSSDVASHNKEEDCWVIMNVNDVPGVYDVTKVRDAAVLLPLQN